MKLANESKTIEERAKPCYYTAQWNEDHSSWKHTSHITHHTTQEQEEWRDSSHRETLSIWRVSPSCPALLITYLCEHWYITQFPVHNTVIVSFRNTHFGVASWLSGWSSRHIGKRTWVCTPRTNVRLGMESCICNLCAPRERWETPPEACRWVV